MQDVAKNMRLTGMLLFRNAFLEALDRQERMCVIHTAYAAEILLKARIAKEHPLLIFSTIPKPNLQNSDPLTLSTLLEQGRTITYDELPDRTLGNYGNKDEQ